MTDEQKRKKIFFKNLQLIIENRKISCNKVINIIYLLATDPVILVAK
jgi:hypothetical protein